MRQSIRLIVDGMHCELRAERAYAPAGGSGVLEVEVRPSIRGRRSLPTIHPNANRCLAPCYRERRFRRTIKSHRTHDTSERYTWTSLRNG